MKSKRPGILVPALKPSVQATVHRGTGCHQPWRKAVQFSSLLKFS